MTDTHETAILAGGCFWGMQDLIRKRPGVISTRVGYTGGDVPNATYRNHGRPRRGHRDRVRPERDLVPRPARVLLPDPRPDHQEPPGQRRREPATGRRSSTPSDEQKRVAEDTIADVDASGLWPGKVVTEVTAAGPFWEAEPEHQDYLEQLPQRLHLPLPASRLEAAAPRRRAHSLTPRGAEALTPRCPDVAATRRGLGGIGFRSVMRVAVSCAAALLGVVTLLTLVRVMIWPLDLPRTSRAAARACRGRGGRRGAAAGVHCTGRVPARVFSAWDAPPCSSCSTPSLPP